MSCNNSESGDSASSNRRLNPKARDFMPSPEKQPALPAMQSTPAVIEIRRASKHKGKGVFATTDIPKGTCIVREEPLLSIPSSDSLRLVWGPYIKLSAEKQSIYDELAYFLGDPAAAENEARLYLIDYDTTAEHHIEIDVSKRVKVMGQFGCNDFMLGDSGAFGVFATASRINHSCRPNVFIGYNTDIRCQLVHTMRDIVAGEEILTNYCGGQMTYYTTVQRQQLLRANYGFICDCAACNDPSRFSDARRTLLAKIVCGLEKYRGKVDPKEDPRYIPASDDAALRCVDKVIELLMEEGIIHMELAKAYHIGSTYSFRCKLYKKAVEYAEKEAQVERYCLGSEISDVKKLGHDAATHLKLVRRWISREQGGSKAQRGSEAVKSHSGSIETRPQPSKPYQSQGQKLAKKAIKARKAIENRKREDARKYDTDYPSLTNGSFEHRHDSMADHKLAVGEEIVKGKGKAKSKKGEKVDGMDNGKAELETMRKMAKGLRLV